MSDVIYNRIRYWVGPGKKRYLFVRVDVDTLDFVEGVVVSKSKRESKERIHVSKTRIISRFRYVPGPGGYLVKFGYRSVRKPREKAVVEQAPYQEAA